MNIKVRRDELNRLTAYKASSKLFLGKCVYYQDSAGDWHEGKFKERRAGSLALLFTFLDQCTEKRKTCEDVTHSADSFFAE